MIIALEQKSGMKIGETQIEIRFIEFHFNFSEFLNVSSGEILFNFLVSHKHSNYFCC
jgi:hypothetical protein